MPSSSLAAVFIFSFALAIGAVVSPGPVSAAIVSQSPRNGWLVGPLVATGHSFLELMIVLLIAFGLSSGLADPGIQTWIAILGGILLIWMGGNMFWDSWRGKTRLPDQDAMQPGKSRWQMISLGIAATISNPFWYAWWVTVAAGYLAQARELGLAAVIAFYIGHISADYAWDTVLSAIVGGGSRWLNNRLYQGILLLCGGFMSYIGVVFLLQGLA